MFMRPAGLAMLHGYGSRELAHKNNLHRRTRR
jgi:hypothetical protein